MVVSASMIDYDHNAIDELLQSRVRLVIVAYPASAREAEFSVLRTAIKTTDGHASVQLPPVRLQILDRLR
jgi:hypothetical protein